MLIVSAAMLIAAFATTVSAAAKTHTVVKGDSMWKIAVKYQVGLSELKSANAHIKNPALIYPGQIITIPTVDSSKVQPFLLADTVLPLDCDALPYVFGNNDGRELIAETENVYVKGNVVKGTQYGVYHKGDLIKDEEGKELGYKAIFVGVIVTADGEANNLTKAFIVKNKSAVQRGDYLLPLNDFAGNNLYFVPKAAKVDTSVVSLGLDGKVAGQYDTVMLGKGSKDGVTPGDVFSIMREGKQITGRDVSSNKYAEFDGLAKRMTASSENKLPNELIGQVMVYRTYENVSLAIIMKAKDSVSVGYKALQP